MCPDPHDEVSFNLALALQYTEDYAEAREVLEILLERNLDFEGAFVLVGDRERDHG